MLAAQPEGGALARFLPGMDGEEADKDLRCRAAVASTFLGGLELARSGTLALQQTAVWQEIQVRAR